MNAKEAEDFENSSNFEAIIKVREWDENAKCSDMLTKPLNHYVNLCKSYIKTC